MTLHVTPGRVLICSPVRDRVVVQVDRHKVHADTDFAPLASVILLVDVGVERVHAVDQPPSNVHVEWACLHTV